MDVLHMDLLRYGILSTGYKGAEVQELQMILSGFNGGIPDGDFGPKTEQQVKLFQRDYMGEEQPSGVVGRNTIEGLLQFSKDYPLDFDVLRCPCGECDGFGNGRYRGKYREGKPRIERYNMHEYPGIHKITLWTYKAMRFYIERKGLFEAMSITSGYRCSIRNDQKHRTSTNHHGKALDCQYACPSGKRMEIHNTIRNIAVDKNNCQLGWATLNKKALEPESIAPTWIHLDCRGFGAEYREDHFFVKSEEALIRMLV